MEINNQNKSLQSVERITKLMDNQFNIKGFKFGLDPLLNLIPFLGDGVSVVISGMLIYTMAKHGASQKVKAKLILNVAIDALIGAIPLLGWFFDFYFKANQRNLALLKEHYFEGKHQGKASGIILWLALLLMLVLVGGIFILWQLGEWIMSLF